MYPRFVSDLFVAIRIDSTKLQQEAYKIRHFLQLQPISFFQPDMSHQFTSSRSRFRVELAVDDGKDSATFVVFAKEMTKLINREATNLALEQMSGGEEYLEELAGYEYVSQLRVTPYNFTPNHRPNVSYSDISNPPPVVDMESGEATESANTMGWWRYHRELVKQV
ncbi:hypothetical protein HID58_018328 [Brassica napus]|uniref:Replication factor A C-terminal domain-containing protein n=2 Tax=Brassica TaxID=3705 RepID=A0ABQ8D9N4_BRANA|nr:hypothetical protein HID58_018328 [Brassica napus]